jgi:hypothetical protein
MLMSTDRKRIILSNGIQCIFNKKKIKMEGGEWEGGVKRPEFYLKTT